MLSICSKQLKNCFQFIWYDMILPPPFFLFSGILKTVFIFGLTFLPFSRFTYELHYGNDPLCCELNIPWVNSTTIWYRWSPGLCCDSYLHGVALVVERVLWPSVVRGPPVEVELGSLVVMWQAPTPQARLESDQVYLYWWEKKLLCVHVMLKSSINLCTVYIQITNAIHSAITCTIYMYWYVFSPIYKLSLTLFSEMKYLKCN